MIDIKDMHLIHCQSIARANLPPPNDLCGDCEFFDGGGIGENFKPINHHGDCHNRASPRFTTTQADTCDHFVPCTWRFGSDV